MSDRRRGTTVPPGPAGIEHADWELPEVLAAVILLAFVVLTVTGVVSGVVAGLGREAPQLTTAQVVGLSIQDATSWADPPLAFVLVSSMWLVWWQVRIWSAEIALADEADGDVDDGDGDSPVLLAAFDHLLRAKTLASWSLPLFFGLLTAAGVGAAGSFLLYRGQDVGASGALWTNHLEALGFAAATWVLGGAGLVAAVYVRTQVSHEFTLAEEAANEAERRAEEMARRASQRAAKELDEGRDPGGETIGAPGGEASRVGGDADGPGPGAVPSGAGAVPGTPVDGAPGDDVTDGPAGPDGPTGSDEEATPPGGDGADSAGGSDSGGARP